MADQEKDISESMEDATEHDLRERILIADDDADIRTLLNILFRKEGWSTVEAANGEEAIACIRQYEDISLVVLDIMMPVMDGIQTAKTLRSLTDAPILFLTARSSDSDKMNAYRSGGDDYIVKPFHATDLRLKVRAMLERYGRYRRNTSRNQDEKVANVISPSEGIEVNLSENLVTKNGEEVGLTEREYQLLCFFCHNRKRTLSPSEIYEAVWEEPYLSTSSNTVIVHIANLRKKLEVQSRQPFIRTVWGKGYRID